jgi:hypothetical protein
MQTSQTLENDTTEIDHGIDLFIGWQIIILSGSHNRSKFSVIIRQLSQTLKDVSACSHRTSGLASSVQKDSQMKREYMVRCHKPLSLNGNARKLSFLNKALQNW